MMKVALALCLLALVCPSLSRPSWKISRNLRKDQQGPNMCDRLRSGNLKEELNGIKQIGGKLAKGLRDAESMDEMDWSVLSDEEWEKLQLLEKAAEVLPKPREGARSIFLDRCVEEYMDIDFSQFESNGDNGRIESFEDARNAALDAIEICGDNGFREMTEILNVDEIDAQDCKSEAVQEKLQKLSVGVGEMSELGEYFWEVLNAPQPENGESFNDALKPEEEDEELGSDETEDDENAPPSPPPPSGSPPPPPPSSGPEKKSRYQKLAMARLLRRLLAERK